jgi:serine/threonine protein kinase
VPFQPGTRLGPYEILSALGAGGMGEVYRARDTKLNRDVALKILPDLVATDPGRLAVLFPQTFCTFAREFSASSRGKGSDGSRDCAIRFFRALASRRPRVRLVGQAVSSRWSCDRIE